MERCACYDYGWCPYLGEVDCRGYIEWCDYEWFIALEAFMALDILKKDDK